MNKLVFIHNNRPVTDSLTVSEVFGKEHARVMRDIRDLGCSEEFRLGNFADSHYENLQGRKMPKIIMTEQGFTLLAMGYTGPRAMEFKEQYISEFHRMREELNSNKVVALDERKVRMELLKTALEHEERLDLVEDKIQLIEKKVDEQITLDHGEQREMQKAIARRVYELETDPAARRELFSQIHREIKDRWAVGSYRDVRRTELKEVIRYINAWIPKRVA
ncbi:Rha family transcriptional regulator [Paenibacillus senegalensis]|uniref:Rha family transcriptional regulator n=1 Tax=Paenibacillus senegalensis TaxID=1465766 RepID=UPI000287C5E4|nr:Rha family transcriptional regulator [Paenibacillus senegalensis]